MTTTDILIINGSVRGALGNSGKIVAKAQEYLRQFPEITTSVVTLTDNLPNIEEVRRLLEVSKAFFIVSGTYWSSWGSSLQKFIEVVTPFENSPVFFGKPIACAVSMDSVGGMEIAARIHGVFSGFGCWSPPCSTLVVSRVGQEAIAASAGSPDDPNEDVWRLEDIEVVLKNLVASVNLKGKWDCWPNVQFSTEGGPWPSTGPLDLDSPRFL